MYKDAIREIELEQERKRNELTGADLVEISILISSRLDVLKEERMNMILHSTDLELQHILLRSTDARIKYLVELSERVRVHGYMFHNLEVY